jgi:hypothetical protein
MNKADTIQSIQLPVSVALWTKEAASFPGGVQQAHQALHTVMPADGRRGYYGISWFNEAGGITYLAATSKLNETEANPGHFGESFIEAGIYRYIDIENFMQHIPAIGEAFKKLMADPGCDASKPCIEWYLDKHTCRCMLTAKKQ